MSDNKWPAPNKSKFPYPITGIKLENMVNVVEELGLPGDRYITYFEKNSITLWFQRSEDAVFYTLKF